jgi:catechol 2,3-dioxygenase-like lactoylglutathione lyase family enzyme
MDVLSSRVLLHPADPARSRHFYRDLLGLAVYREFGDPSDPSLVFFLGGGFLEISSAADPAATGNVSLWLQVRSIQAEHERLAGLDVTVLRPPKTEPWGLREMWISDPDGVRIVLVEVPEQHPIRRDTRGNAE